MSFTSVVRSLPVAADTAAVEKAIPALVSFASLPKTGPATARQQASNAPRGNAATAAASMS